MKLHDARFASNALGARPLFSDGVVKPSKQRPISFRRGDDKCHRLTSHARSYTVKRCIRAAVRRQAALKFRTSAGLDVHHAVEATV
jgi:hypothetical protein